MNSSEAPVQSYLLGESIRNIFTRLTLIVSCVIVIWLFITLIAIFYNRRIQKKKISQWAQQIYDHRNNFSNQFSRHYRYDSSSTAPSNKKWYPFDRILPQLKRERSFGSGQKQKLYLMPKIENSPIIGGSNNSVHVQAAIAAMTRASLHDHEKEKLNKKDSLSMAPTTQFYRSERSPLVRQQAILEDSVFDQTTNSTPSDILRKNKNNQFLSPSCSATNSPQSLSPLHTRHFSQFDLQSETTNTVQMSKTLKKNRSQVSLAATRDLKFYQKWPWKHAKTVDVTPDGNLMISSQRNLPLVMITDTNTSYTDIVELDTFDDKLHRMTEIEKRLRRQLKTHYRPRYST